MPAAGVPVWYLDACCGLRGSEQACERRVARVARADADHPGTRADAGRQFPDARADAGRQFPGARADADHPGARS